jgi:hypothetical protein
MPPLAIHTRIAKETADVVNSGLLDTARGSLYLGSTTPDVRVLTRWARERTHFFDIHNFEDQSCVDAFFESNPLLADAGSLEAATSAFVAGYLSHLVVDEMWIGSIYRPHFGERSPLSGTLRANVMDRALQFSMDAEARGDEELMAHVLEAVARCDLNLGVDFIDGDTLARWHQVVTDFVQSQPDWERFRSRVRTHLESMGQVTDAGEYEELAQSLPEIVDETLRYLGRERVDEVMRDSLEASVRVVKEYLACA